MRGGQRIAQAAQRLEAGARGGFVFREGSDGHEAAHVELRQIGQALEQFAEFGAVGLEAGFGGFLAELDFDEDGQRFVERGGGVLQALGEG